MAYQAGPQEGGVGHNRGQRYVGAQGTIPRALVRARLVGVDLGAVAAQLARAGGSRLRAPARREQRGKAVGRTIEGTAADGHGFSIYRADPAGAPRGGLVIVQEIFGVNSHIRAVCDGYAAEGYVAAAMSSAV